MVESSLILLVVVGLEAPFVAYGVFRFIGWALKIWRIRKGFLAARFILPNRQEKEILSKPSGDKITVKGKTFNYDKTKLTFKGNMPIQTYDSELLEPIDITDTEKADKLSSDDVSNIVIRAYNLGMIAGTNLTKRLNQLIIIILVVAVLAVLVAGYNKIILTGMQEMFTTLPETLAETLTKAIAPLKTNVPTG